MRKRTNYKKIFAALFSAVLAVTSVPAGFLPVSAAGASKSSGIPVSGEMQREGWQLVWNDEFEGTYLDQSKWRLGSSPENGRHKYNTSVTEEGELENENVCLEDGELKLKATDIEDYTGENGKTYVCKSGMIETYKKASWRYGRVDVRAKLPVARGMWPAIWMMPETSEYGWPKDGEIDIMELISQEKNTVYGTLHCGTSGTPDYYHPAETYRLAQGTFFDDYHVFSMEWDPGVIRIYMDDHLFATFDDWKSVVDGTRHDYPHPFNAPFYLKLNLAAGGSWCENPDATTPWGEETTMSVDYVRVYKRENPSYDYSREAFPASDHLQGAVWYAQMQEGESSWSNMSVYDASEAAWEENGLKVGKTDMTPGGQDTAIGFSAPEDGYVRIHLKEEAVSEEPFQLRFTKGTLQQSRVVLAVFDSLEEGRAHKAADSCKNVYLPVLADDFIRIEASGEGSSISQLEPVISYVSEETYGKAVRGELPAEAVIRGEAAVGRQLSAAILEGNLSSRDVTYRWRADGENIPNAVSRTFTPGFQELGKAITVRLTSRDGTVLETSPTSPVEDHCFIDDLDPSIRYTGFSGPSKREDAIGGTFHWSSNNAASDIEYTFTGTGVQILAYVHTYWTSRQTVTVTNSKGETAASGTADCHAASDADNGKKAIAYSVTDLPYDTYTIHVTNDGTKNKMEFDGFYVYNTGDSPKPYDTYPVTFDGNGQDLGEAPSAASCSEGYELRLPANPFTRKGFTFAGWNDGSRIYGEGEIYTMPGRPVNFRAEWKETPAAAYELRLDAAGGTVSPDRMTVTEGKPYPALPAPVRAGWTFLGWFTQGSQQIREKDICRLTDHTTVFARWSRNQEKVPVPSGLKASSKKTNSITLKWNKVPHASGYLLERYESSTGKWKKLKDVTASKYTDKKVKYGTVYRYRVRAYIKSGQSQLEGEASAVLAAAAAPKKPVLSWKKTGNGKVKLSWKKGTRADKFELSMKKGKGSYRKLLLKAKNLRSYTKAGLKKGVTYRFRLRGYKKAGKQKIYSSYSAVQKIVL